MNIWENHILYSMLRPYADWCTRTSYSSYRMTGQENIPSDGVVIFAPNHCNALMDAMNVLQARKGPTAFGARADMFRKPLLAKFLTFIRIVPLARERDGRQALVDNAGVFSKITECLRNGVPFCIFSEGTHRTKRSLLPIKKGIARIALQAARDLDKPVYIQPIGLEYDDYFLNMVKFQMNYGKPIDVSGLLASMPGASDAEINRTICEQVKERLSGLITYFPDNENYDDAWEQHLKQTTHPKRWWDYILAAIAFPIFCALAVAALPMWLPAVILNSRFEDKTWYNTVRYAIKFVETPLLTLIYGITAFCLLPWWAALCITILAFYLHPAYYRLLNLYRKPTRI